MPGGIWGRFFDANLAGNFRCLPFSAAQNFVEVSITPSIDSFKNWGEQAGIFLMRDDNNYLKIVVECMKDLSIALVLAVEVDGNPSVAGKIVVDKENLLAGNDEDEDDSDSTSASVKTPRYKRITLRLEITDNGKMIVGNI